MFGADLLAGRTALVTGASSGLGRHFAHVLAHHGARVIAAARRREALDAVAATLGETARAVTLDVRDAAAVARTMADLGPLDIVVNNAGIALTGKAVEVDDDDWQRVLDTDLSGAFRVARGAARALADARRGGVIVNVASILGLRVAKQVPAYVAAKAGLLRLTEALALEFAPLGIRVNALAPGYVETDLNREFLHSPAGDAMVKRVPMRRFGQPQDLDGALLLLVSDAGRYMTGSTIVVDGGHTLAWL